MAGSKMSTLKETRRRRRQARRPVTPPADYSHLFTGQEYDQMMHRAMLMQRLVQDPFYTIMNVNTASRLWMMRNLTQAANYTKSHFHLNLLEFFEFLNPAEMLKFMRYKSAPVEMCSLWVALHPSALKPLPEKKAQPPPENLKTMRVLRNKNKKKNKKNKKNAAAAAASAATAVDTAATADDNEE